MFVVWFVVCCALRVVRCVLCAVCCVLCVLTVGFRLLPDDLVCVVGLLIVVC